MKYYIVAILTAVAMHPLKGFVNYYKGVKLNGVNQNVVLKCGEGTKDEVLILSSGRTGASRGELFMEGRSQLFTASGRIVESKPWTPGSIAIFSMQLNGPVEPLSNVRENYFSSEKGIYENNNFQLDLRSFKVKKIILKRADGLMLQCSIEENCC
jgi:hypothetical protein